MASLGALLAEGLGAVHAAGLVHRDLKAQNIILGDFGPVIIDFGLGAFVGASKGSLTQAGMLIGTVRCMPPEQALGDLDVHTVALVLSRVVGAVGGNAVHVQQGAVQDHKCLVGGHGHGLVEGGGKGGQDLNRLDYVPVDGGQPDPEAGREQSLSVRGQAAPARAALTPTGRQQVGQVVQGRVGQIDPRWVGKRVKLRAERLILVDNPSTRSFTFSSELVTRSC